MQIVEGGRELASLGGQVRQLLRRHARVGELAMAYRAPAASAAPAAIHRLTASMARPATDSPGDDASLRHRRVNLEHQPIRFEVCGD